MPWQPRVTEEELRTAVLEGRSWREVLDALDYRYHGKNIETVRKWASRWGVSTAHLTDRRGQPRRGSRYSDDELARAVATSLSYAETLRRLGYCPTGANWLTLKKRVARLRISTSHFDPYAAARRRGRATRIPLEQVLVKGSTYSRGTLKRRLFEEGLKERRCELCAQDENWRGRKMGLILDHINGVRDDNRLENLRIVCPNCAATLDTHCGRNVPRARACEGCGMTFQPRTARHRFCSRECFKRHRVRDPVVRLRETTLGIPRPETRKVERPPYLVLLAEIEKNGYLATGRKYGVSDNAIRKWVRFYERERERQEHERMQEAA
jgi:transposase-like protein